MAGLPGRARRAPAGQGPGPVHRGSSCSNAPRSSQVGVRAAGVDAVRQHHPAPRTSRSFRATTTSNVEIRAFIRWNAAVMVIRANKVADGIGGHLSTFASSALAVRDRLQLVLQAARRTGLPGDHVYFQGHAAPWRVCAGVPGGPPDRRTSSTTSAMEIGGNGLSSYPHPRLMPDFWEYPTVSMGLGPINSIYHARFNRYLHAPTHRRHLGLEGVVLPRRRRVRRARDAGRHLAGRPLLPRQPHLGRQLQPPAPRRTGAGQRQASSRSSRASSAAPAGTSSRSSGAALGRAAPARRRRRPPEQAEHDRRRRVPAVRHRGRCLHPGELLRPRPALRRMVEHLSDDEIRPTCPAAATTTQKVYAAYSRRGRATSARRRSSWPRPSRDGPSVEGFEGRNATHQIKKMTKEQLLELRSRLHLEDEIPESALEADGCRRTTSRPVDSDEYRYMLDRGGRSTGPCPSPCGSGPVRAARAPGPQDLRRVRRGLAGPASEPSQHHHGVHRRSCATFCATRSSGRASCRSCPTRRRTFGMDSLFREFEIYAPMGQLYEPVDHDLLLSATPRTRTARSSRRA